ncbi:hypothetical protein TNIN_153341 [Trichonephila inaurata madagascariensis]|uniref:Uncharacterized protein n=1 Tax=Trichonephila inaurata madagascariensis TaxID=2747483 RepID=A0A8X7C9G7_9ARAC|nr:hypothetical protein TNIN_153341 [Trichonephila inaurata madagascariensis]
MAADVTKLSGPSHGLDPATHPSVCHKLSTVGDAPTVAPLTGNRVRFGGSRETATLKGKARARKLPNPGWGRCDENNDGDLRDPSRNE